MFPLKPHTNVRNQPVRPFSLRQYALSARGHASVTMMHSCLLCAPTHIFHGTAHSFLPLEYQLVSYPFYFSDWPLLSGPAVVYVPLVKSFCPEICGSQTRKLVAAIVIALPTGRQSLSVDSGIARFRHLSDDLRKFFYGHIIQNYVAVSIFLTNLPSNYSN